MSSNIRYILLFSYILFISVSSYAQDEVAARIEEAGKFEDWKVLQIKESGIIGGHTKYIYKMEAGDTVVSNEPYKAPEGTIFAASNVMANIIGIIKTSNSVSPEKRGDGYCAKLQVVEEKVKAIGMINLVVTAQGTIISGSLEEPITDTNSPYSKLNYGIPYTGRPRGLQYDYKATVGNIKIRATGLSPRKVLDEKDYADIVVFLQKRYEDEKGNITAKRVGTAYKRIFENVPEWVNGEVLEIKYGDITGWEGFKPYMDLRNSKSEIENCALNSKGKSTPIEEIGWADADETPTHIIIWFSSSDGKAFFGGVGNVLWVDNVKLVF